MRRILLPLVLLICLGVATLEAADRPESQSTPPNSNAQPALRKTANSLEMEMIQIPAGEYVRGSEKGDFDEVPTHRVKITQPFWMSATEVTNAQYEQFDPEHKQLRGARGLSHDDDEAVVFVSWEDAQRFCQWLSKREGKTYRLPTEAEWEYACRAGTTTEFSPGSELPEAYHKHQKMEWDAVPVKLHVGRTPANPWGLFDMHGNVEEWCHDWYGPYESAEQVDPVGRRTGDFRVTRGGSHSTLVEYLRSANRLGTLPENRHWMLGFRIVQGELPTTEPLPTPTPEPWARNVEQAPHDWKLDMKADEPYFKGPRPFVKIPPKSNGPLFSKHNHQPAITACPNGDLLAVWYTTNTEPGRELAVVAARLRQGSEEWEPAAPFWDTPDRNDHGNALWWDGEQTLYHINGLSTDGTWGKLALVLRTSTDNGVTWSPASLINPHHQHRNQVIAGTFRIQSGAIIQPCDAVPGGHGGTAIHISHDGGKTWSDPGAGQPKPNFAEGASGGWIAGIHAGVTQLADGRLMAFGRGDSINGRMPMSISSDLGKTWNYSASEFPPIGGGQRLVLRKLQDNALLLVSFAKEMEMVDATGKQRTVSGMFAALSEDDGKTWPVRKLITDGGPPREIDGGAWTQIFTIGPNTAEPKGYLAVTQTPNGLIHLISSAQHYTFNTAWLKAPLRAEPE